MLENLMPVLVHFILICPCALVAAEKGYHDRYEDTGQMEDSSPQEMFFDVTNHGRFIRRKDLVDEARRTSYDEERSALLERASHVLEQLRHNRDDVIEEPRRKEQPRDSSSFHRHHRSHSKSQYHHHDLSISHGRQHDRGEASMLDGRSRFGLASDMDTVDPDAPGAPQDQTDSRPDALPNLSQDQLDDLVKQEKVAHIDDTDGAEDGPMEASNQVIDTDQSESGKDSSDDTADVSEDFHADSSSDDDKASAANPPETDGPQSGQEVPESSQGEGRAEEAITNSNLRASKAMVNAAPPLPALQKLVASRSKTKRVTDPSQPQASKSVDGSHVAQVSEKTSITKTLKEFPQTSQQNMNHIAESLGSPNGVLHVAKKPAETIVEQRIDIVEKLQSQYSELVSTLQATKTEEQTLHKELLDAMGERSAGTFKALSVAGLVTFVVVAACAVLLRIEPHAENPLHQFTCLPKHAWIQAVSFGWTLISTAQCVVMMPDAYGLPWQPTFLADVLQGPNVIMSSLLLILVSSEGARRLMRPWCQTRNRTVVLSLILGQLCTALLFTAASDITDPLGLGETLQQTVVIVSRLGLGMCLGFANILLAMAVKVTPPERMMHFAVSRSSAMCVGAGVGAFVSASLDGPASLSTQLLLLICLPWASLFALSVLTIPEDIEPLLRAPSAPEGSCYALKPTGKTTAADDEAIIIASRKKIWLLALMAIFFRGVLTTSFECIITNVFVTDFLFSDPQVLIAIGCSLVCGAFVMPLMVIAKHVRTSVDIGSVCVVGGCCTVFATMILVRHFSQYSAPRLCGMWLLFSVTTVALPAINLVGGIMEAIGLQHSLVLQQILGDTAFSQENLIIVGFLLRDSVCRFAVPSAERSLLFYGGQALCAVWLFIMATIVFISTFCARDVLESIGSSSATDALPLKVATIYSGTRLEGAA